MIHIKTNLTGVILRTELVLKATGWGIRGRMVVISTPVHKTFVYCNKLLRKRNKCTRPSLINCMAFET